MKNADTPAMPLEHTEVYQCSEGLPLGCSIPKERSVVCHGLTKREMFAMHAMQGLFADNTYADLYETSEDWVKNVTEASVEFADALLMELEK